MYYNMFNELMENPFLPLTILRREHLTNFDHVAELAAICLTLYMQYRCFISKKRNTKNY